MPSTYTLSTFLDCGALGELDCNVTFTYKPRTPDTRDFPGDPSETNILSLEWPCDSGYLQATFDHLTEHDQENLLEECEAHALECISEGGYDE